MRLLGWNYLSRDEILQIAKERCRAEGWSWNDPVLVSEGPLNTLVTTNANMKGGNARILVDARSGCIRAAGFAKR